MGFYARRVVPRLVDLTCGNKAFDRVRARVCAGLRGEVLEVGFGSGRNIVHYPAEVSRVLAVDPSLEARRLAGARVAASATPIEFVGLDGEALALDDAAVDHVLCTWTLCTIPDAGRALAEMHRVLRPGGQLHFVEHGLAPRPDVARWQHRLTPLQRRIAGGCHLDRPIDALIRSAGFELSDCATYYGARPRAFAHFYEGRALR